jgi:hypothetical protein
VKRGWLKNGVGSAILVAACLAAILRSRPRGAIPRLHPLPIAAAQELYADAAEAEVLARQKAIGRFRGSPWSQDDEFHNKEAKLLRGEAMTRRVPLPVLIDNLDRGMHEGWPTGAAPAPDQTVLPCRPRLNY